MFSVLKKSAILWSLILLLFSGCVFLPDEEEEISLTYKPQNVPEYRLYTVKESGLESTFTGIGNVVSVSRGSVLVEMITSEYEAVYVGMNVKCTFNNFDYTGTIVFTSADKDLNMTGYNFCQNYNGVGIKLNSVPRGISENATVSVYALLSSKSGVITIPTSAVYEYNGKNYVYIWDGLVRTEREVELGIRSASFYEVLSGLSVGEQITCR